MYGTVLIHHGRKGQRWGITNGPPYPIDETKLPKNSRLNSISTIANTKKYISRRSNGESIPIYTYDPDDSWDSSIYKGPFSVYKSDKGRRFVYEHQLESIKDFSMPSYDERVERFIEMYKNNPATVRDIEYIQRQMRKNHVGTRSAREVDVRHLDLDNKKAVRAAYELFNQSIEDKYRFMSADAYIREMSKKYDAMIDDNNITIYNGAHRPIIVFDATQSLRSISNGKKLSEDEIQENYRHVESVLSKQGKKVRI